VIAEMASEQTVSFVLNVSWNNMRTGIKYRKLCIFIFTDRPIDIEVTIKAYKELPFTIVYIAKDTKNIIKESLLFQKLQWPNIK
jgi:hypothetical protein